MKKLLLTALTLTSIATLTGCDGSYTTNGYTSSASQDAHWHQRQYNNPATAAQPSSPANSGYSSSTGAPVQNVYTSSPASLPAQPAAPVSNGYSSSAPAPAQPTAAAAIQPTVAAQPPAAATTPAVVQPQPSSSGYSSGNSSFPVNPDDQSNSTAVPSAGYSSGQ